MEPEKKSNGAMVGLVIIIIILILGGLYMWKLDKDTVENLSTEPETVTTQDSAELNTLDADLEATDTNTGVDVNTVN